MSETARPSRLSLAPWHRTIFLIAAVVACCTLTGCGSQGAATLSVTTHPGNPGAATSASLRYRGNIYGAEVQAADVPVRGSFNAILRALGAAPQEPVHSIDEVIELLGTDGWNVVLTDVFDKNNGKTKTVVMQLARGERLAWAESAASDENGDSAGD